MILRECASKLGNSTYKVTYYQEFFGPDNTDYCHEVHTDKFDKFRKIVAVSKYKSQVRDLFGNNFKMTKDILKRKEYTFND